MNLSQHVKQVHLLEISQNVLVEVNSTPIIVCVCVCVRVCVRACVRAIPETLLKIKEK